MLQSCRPQHMYTCTPPSILSFFLFWATIARSTSAHTHVCGQLADTFSAPFIYWFGACLGPCIRPFAAILLFVTSLSPPGCPALDAPARSQS